jgi:hypothetical protein
MMLIRLLAAQAERQSFKNAHLPLLLANSHGQLPAK